ncbi:hypothetical protein [Nitrosomonas sp.]|uniref:hypothetical protein n=1 Tax=Nitrosomonas sp. TaxID=42353 RepID=UPI0025D674B6|nr:hypothetical protein [Nitrosomonas sp.]
MEQEEGQLGYVRYSGELVKNGYLDARKSAQALLGVDEAVRFFVYQQAPELRAVDFEFPVKVKKGSWEIVIGGILLAYGIKAAQKMAENDFKDVGLKDIFKKALCAIQWMIRIGKHMGDLTIKKFENVQFKDGNALIGIRNSQGEYLYVPKEFLDFYASASPTLLKKMSGVVEEERSLSVGIYDDQVVAEETITRKHRQIFTHEVEEPGEVLFPEFEHGQSVVLEGELTRGNEMSNTVGISYQGHILNGLPEVGSIVRFKPSLFLRCRVYGRVSREDEKGSLDARRPRIIFTKIERLESDDDNHQLFRADKEGMS